MFNIIATLSVVNMKLLKMTNPLYRISAVLAISLSVVVSCTRTAKDYIASIPSEFDEYCQNAFDQWQIPAMSVVVVKDNEVVYLKGFGKTKQDETGVPVDPEKTQFVLASTTKAMTGSLLAMVVDQYDVDWTDPVKKHLPDFRMYDPWVSENMMVGEVNSHHNGWKEYAMDDLPFFGYDRDDLYHIFAAIKPTYGFRTKYAYNNEMYTVDAKIIEKYTGMSWDDAMAEKMFKPLGMVHSTTGAKAYRTSPDLAYGYRVHYDPDKDDMYLEPRDDREDAFTWLSAVAPAAFVMTTASDMANYIKMHLGHGVFEGDTLITRKNHDYLFAPQSVSGFSDNLIRTYGQGWGVEQNSKVRYIRHTGLGYGYTSLVGLVPELNLGFAFMSTNGTTSNSLEGMGQKLIDMYLGIDGEDYALVNLEKYKDSKRVSSPEDKPVEVKDPTLPLSKYVGRYAQEQFGQASVTLEDDALHFRLRKVDSVLKHVTGDTFSFHVDGAGHFDLTFKVEGGVSKSLTFDIGDPICDLVRVR